MSNKEQVRYGYMCKIDFDYEVGEALGGNTIYPSLEDLQEEHPHKTCGTVKVKITLEEVITETRFGATDE